MSDDKMPADWRLGLCTDEIERLRAERDALVKEDEIKAGVNRALLAEIERLRAEIERLRADLSSYIVAATKDADSEIAWRDTELKRLRDWLVVETNCPCCQQTERCTDDCTFETDAPDGYTHIEEVRALLRGDTGLKEQE